MSLRNNLPPPRKQEIMTNNPATESTAAQGDHFSQEVLFPEQKCKTGVSHLSDNIDDYPGSGPTAGTKLTAIIIPGRLKPKEKRQKHC